MGGTALKVKRGRSPMSDAPGYDLKPDLDAVRTFADLTAALRDFRVWAGEPSYRKMAADCGQLLSSTAIYRALHSDRPITATAVQAVIRGCGGTEDDEARFVRVWMRVNTNTKHTTGESR
jgi:hypothetical protein